MNDIQILGKYPMYGELVTQGSKNAVLPMMAASLLHPGVTVLENVPLIRDVAVMASILRSLGATVTRDGHTMIIDASDINNGEIPPELARKMRSSVVVLGPLTARLGQAVTYYPGGCSIGKRPVDYHIQLLRELGIRVTEEDGRIEAVADGYEGTVLHLAFPSVGATENAMMAAVGASGDTVICGCAREPEILELCLFLKAMGIRILGAGTEVIRVCGQKTERDPIYRVGGDRIAAGTYLAAAAVSGGEICLKEAPVTSMMATLQALCACGCQIQTEGQQIWLRGPRYLRPIPYLETAVYPGFPTDMQSVMLAVQCCASGESVLQETIFEDRMETTAELVRMGAGIRTCGCKAFVRGTGHLVGTDVTARDLRGGAALIVAGLGAEGTTVVHDCGHVDRGYENIVEDMRILGARIHRICDEIYEEDL